jgi:hypothetical protein
MTIDVDGPDGATISFPDETDADTIHKTMSQHYGAAQEPSAFSDIAKSAPGAIVKGFSTAAAAGPLLVNTLAHGISAGLDRLGYGDTDFGRAYWRRQLGLPDDQGLTLKQGVEQAEANRQAIAQATGPKFYEHEPQTTPGKYTSSVLEMLPGMLAGGPTGYLKGLLTRAVAPGVGAEAGRQYFQGTPYETAAGVVGGLIGGGVGGVAEMPRTAEAAIGTRLPKYVTPQRITDAQSLMADARNMGVNLTWPEALSRVTGKPVLTDLQRELEGASQTRERMGEFFADRPEAMDRAALETFGKIAPATTTPSLVGQEAQRTAKGVLGEVRGKINKYAEPYYQGAEGRTIDPNDWVTIQQTPGYHELRDRIRNNPHLNADVAHLPDNSVGFLNEVKKQFDIDARNAAKSSNPIQNTRIAGSLAQGAQTVKNAAIKASPEYDVALTAEREARREFLDPLMAGPLGKMAKSPDTQRAMDALFPDGPLANSHHEIADAVGKLSGKNPLIASQLVRGHLESTWNQAAKQAAAVTGTSQFGGANWFKAIGGNPQQLENVKAAVRALPDGDARWNALENFMRITRATGERQNIGSKTSFNDQDLAALAQGGKAATAVKYGLSPAKWLSAAYDLVGKWQAGRNMNILAKILTDPTAGPTLRTIAATRDPDALRRLMGRLVAQTAQTASLPGQPKAVDVSVRPYQQ